MKKFLFVLLSFLICGQAFASTYAVEKPDESVVLVSTSNTITEYLADVGMSGYPYIEVSEIPEGPMECFRLVDDELIVDETCSDSQEIAIKYFDAELAIAREAQVFDASALVRLMPVSYSINELIRFRNFCGGVANGVPYAGLKQIGEALVAGGQILQADLNTLNNILLEQGIDLGACS